MPKVFDEITNANAKHPKTQIVYLVNIAWMPRFLDSIVIRVFSSDCVRLSFERSILTNGGNGPNFIKVIINRREIVAFIDGEFVPNDPKAKLNANTPRILLK